MILIKICRIGEYFSFDQLIQKLEALEKRLASSGGNDHRAGGKLADPGIDWEPKEAAEAPWLNSHEGIRREDWERFLKFLGSKNRAMANVLKDWPLLHTSGNTIEIGKGGSQFSSAYLDEPERFQKLMEFCHDFFKRDVQIKITLQKAKEEKVDEPSRAESKRPDLPPPVQDVLDIFQGTVREEISATSNREENTGRDKS
jgi:hypothetical protein